MIWLNDERMEVSPGTFVITPGTIKEHEDPSVTEAAKATSENSPNKQRE